jgi:hypothetical protein
LYGRREVTFDLDKGIVDIDTHGEEGEEGWKGRGKGDRNGRRGSWFMRK